MRKLIGGAAIALLVAGTALWVTSGLPKEATGLGGDGLPVAGDDAVARSSDDHVVEASAQRPAESEPQSADTESVRESSSFEPYVVVRVVDARDGRPVGGAAVRFLDGKAWTPLMRKGGGAGHSCEVVERHGSRTQTDAEGRCGLPKFTGFVGIVAAKEGRFAYRMIRDKNVAQRQVELRLVEDITLTARVTGPSGPIGELDIGLYELRGKKGVRQRTHRPTNADGLLEIRHLQVHGDKQWILTPTAPFEPAPHVTFATSEAATQTWPLRVPAFGTLAIRVLGPSRKEVRASARASLTLQRPLPWKIGAAKVDLGSRSASRPVGGGEIVFQPVGLGLRFKVDVRVDRARRRMEILGPATPGERRVVDVLLDDRTSVLSGQVTGTRSLRAVLLGPQGWSSSNTPTLDDEGRFELAFVPRSTPSDYELYLTDRRTFAQLRVPVPGFRRGQHRDLGALELTAPDVLVAGRVVDDTGKELANARLSVQRYEAASKKWRTLSFASASSDKDGAFEIRAVRAPGRLQLRVSASRHLSQQQAFAPGERELVVSLARSAELELSARIPAAFRDRLTAELRSAGYRRTTRQRGRKGQVRWKFSGLERGSYELRILFATRLPPVFQRSVLLGPGATKLGEVVDLSSRIHRYEVRLEKAPPNGAKSKPSRVRVYLCLRDGEHSVKELRVSTKKSAFWWPQPSVRCDLVGSGFEPQRHTLTPGTHVFEIERGARVRLEFPGLRSVLGRRPAWIELRPTGSHARFSEGARRRMRSSASLNGETCELVVSTPGTYSVRLRVVRSSPSGPPGRPRYYGRVTMAEVLLGSIEIPAGGTFRVGFDPASVRRALQ